MGKSYALNDGYKIEMPMGSQTPGQLGESQGVVEAAKASGGPGNISHSIKGATGNQTGND